MIDKIIKAMAGTLHMAFDDITIYTENVPQGFCESSFFIRLLNAKQKPLLGNRFFQEYLFDIHYFPKSEYRENEEMNRVTLKLYDILECCHI